MTNFCVSWELKLSTVFKNALKIQLEGYLVPINKEYPKYCK